MVQLSKDCYFGDCSMSTLAPPGAVFTSQMIINGGIPPPLLWRIPAALSAWVWNSTYNSSLTTTHTSCKNIINQESCGAGPMLGQRRETLDEHWASVLRWLRNLIGFIRYYYHSTPFIMFLELDKILQLSCPTLNSEFITLYCRYLIWYVIHNVIYTRHYS